MIFFIFFFSEFFGLIVVNSSMSELNNSVSIYKIEMYGENINSSFKLFEIFNGNNHTFLYERNLFPKLHSNFNKHHIRVATFQYLPYMALRNVVCP